MSSGPNRELMILWSKLIQDAPTVYALDEVLCSFRAGELILDQMVRLSAPAD